VIGIMAAILASLHMRTADESLRRTGRKPTDGQVNSGIGTVGGGDYEEGG
jgi:hypothetical protein